MHRSPDQELAHAEAAHNRAEARRAAKLSRCERCHVLNRHTPPTHERIDHAGHRRRRCEPCLEWSEHRDTWKPIQEDDHAV